MHEMYVYCAFAHMLVYGSQWSTTTISKVIHLNIFFLDRVFHWHCGITDKAKQADHWTLRIHLFLLPKYWSYKYVSLSPALVLWSLFSGLSSCHQACSEAVHRLSYFSSQHKSLRHDKHYSSLWASVQSFCFISNGKLLPVRMQGQSLMKSW